MQKTKKQKTTKKTPSKKKVYIAQNKLLPPINDDIHLGEFGYKLKSGRANRRIALRKAIEKYSILKIMHKVNLIRNYNDPSTDNYKRYTEDVDFLKLLYKTHKRDLERQKSKKK